MLIAQQDEHVKATTLATLKEDISGLLAPIERRAELKKNPIVYTLETKEFDKKLVFKFKSRDHYWVVLEWLEAGYANYIELLTDRKDDYSFSIALKEIGLPVPDRTNRDLALEFIKKFKRHVRQVNNRVKILTPYLTLANITTNPLVLEFPDAGDAAEAMRVLDWTFKVTREKQFITCLINRDERLHFSVKDIKLPDQVTERRKGLVTLSEIRDNFVFDPRMAATFLIDDHSLANYFEFNRKPDPKHMVGIRLSMEMWGVITFCVMAETDCIDGEMKLYVVDGQNRAKSCEYDGYPIQFTKVRVQTKLELVELMVTLNNTNKGWSNNNYLWTWSYLKMPAYTKVKERIFSKDNLVPLSALLPIYQWTIDAKGAMKLFRKGKMVFPKEELSEECIKYLEILKKKNKKLNRDYMLGFYQFFKSLKDTEVPYDNDLMLQKIAEANGTMSFTQKDTVIKIAERFHKLYCEN